jgi:hypothetical protein
MSVVNIHHVAWSVGKPACLWILHDVNLDPTPQSR